MRYPALLAAGGLWGLLGLAPALPRPPLPADAPALAAVEATWRALAQALRHGDRPALLRLTHSSRRHLLPEPLVPLPPEEARQYDFCRPQPEALPTREDEVAYLLVCEVPGERAERFFYLRRDADGIWRIIP